jgi:hypothetical protein
MVTFIPGSFLPVSRESRGSAGTVGHLIGRFWHSFADMTAVETVELVIDRGEGVHVWDEQGRRYLDVLDLRRPRERPARAVPHGITLRDGPAAARGSGRDLGG